MNPPPLLLDTCALIWSLSGAKMRAESIAAINASQARDAAVYMSPISLWEIGLLVARRRVAFSVRQWMDTMRRAPGLVLTDMPGSVLIDSSFLPGAPPNDPADRIMLATARHYGYRLVTRDRKILDYARAGHAAWLAC